jgi:TetR/AcrR family transcriptional regulator
MAQTDERRRTGRPKAHDAPVTLEQILDAAFRAFATYGYDGVAVRTLNRELGVSHNLIHQRFGSKQDLWYAAVDRAFSEQVTELATAFDPTLADPLDQLNHAIRRFMHYSAAHPELLGLMNIEARVDSERLDYIYDNYVAPALSPLGRLLDHLTAEGRIRPITLRTLFFLVAHGAAAPFTLTALARRFENTDPLDADQVREQAALAADVITSGLRLGAPIRCGRSEGG